MDEEFRKAWKEKFYNFCNKYKDKICYTFEKNLNKDNVDTYIDYVYASNHSYFTDELIRRIFETNAVRPFMISKNEKITEKQIEDNIDLNWDWKYISLRNLSIGFIRRNYNRNFDWCFLSSRINIKIIEENDDLPWDIEGISNNPTITISYILNNLDKNFNWFNVSKNKGITIEDVDNNPDLKWDWRAISYGKKYTIDFIRKYKNKLDFYFISSNASIKMSDVVNNPDLPWNYSQISFNSNVTHDFVLKHPDWNWDGNLLAQNKNIHVNKMKLLFKKIKIDKSNIFYNHTLTYRYLKRYKISLEGISFPHANFCMKDFEKINKYDNLNYMWLRIFNLAFTKDKNKLRNSIKYKQKLRFK